MRDFEDTVPMDEADMHSFFCGECDQRWTVGELVDDGQYLIRGADCWRCPNCGAANEV